MLTHTFHIAELIARHLAQTLSPEEEQELETWTHQSPENEALFQKLCNAEQLKQHTQKSLQYSTQNGWEELSQRMHHAQRRSLYFRVMRYAALLILPLAVAMLVTTWPTTDTPLLVSQNESTILPGGKRAILTLDNGQTIDLKSAHETQVKEKDGTAIRIDSTILNYQSSQKSTSPTETVYNKIEIPRGGEYALLLSDGTKVHLNSMSSLRFPVHFSGSVREVELTGEALFEVSHNGTPFIVKTHNTQVEVLGTTFNVSSYEGETYRATLVNGSVRVHTANGNSQLLKPSEQASIAQGAEQIQVSKVNTELYTSWVNGKIHFKDQRLDEIMLTLSRWYDMQVVYADPAVKTLRFGCNINRYKEITPFLDLLERTGKVKITTQGKKIIFEHNN